MIEFIMNNALLITAIFAGIYLLSLLGEHWLKKRVASKKDGDKPNGRTGTSVSHSR